LIRAIWLAELTGCPLYVPHTTIGMAVEEAANARLRGASIHLETCPHYLALTADDERLAAQGAGVGKVAPALRDKENQDRLWWGLDNGLIHTIGSDHVPIAKTGAALWEERPGFAGLGTMLPVVYTYGVAAGRIDLARLAEVTAANPARMFGLYPQKGAIAVGSDADLLLIEPEDSQVVGPATTHSRYTSAFEELPLQGWPIFTIRRGEVLFEEGSYRGKPGTGRVVGPQADFDV
jgi:dihydroorotase-like cyclic amidohydrolase